ncbi:predicted protein [Verticillium alfalfae VaMs.102]|uniref:Predicted protein n=1 Tax=Verticillium alfalfae (strain VaMs.102 / ATCC MYA-4576 / FGSC 10136) TaxID=526221 RepID=C9S9J5_VERA1|nr:predicted protein [Verticillium alfalfae VaMs.102]EEY16058.1 predicted protein [Verticillium alfalfae VaMs.102]
MAQISAGHYRYSQYQEHHPSYRQQHHPPYQHRHHPKSHRPHPQYEQAPPLPPRPRRQQHQHHIAELEVPPCIAVEMPASPVQENPTLRELPDDPSTTALPLVNILSRQRALLDPAAALPSRDSHTPRLISNTTHAGSSYSSSSIAPEDWPRTPVDCPPANYPQAKAPALKLFGSKKAKRRLDKTVDGTPGPPELGRQANTSNRATPQRNWNTIPQTASHRYLEGKLYGPEGRYPHAGAIDEGVVGRPKLPARPVVAPAEAGALVLAREPEVEFPAVGLVPVVVREKKNEKSH